MQRNSFENYFRTCSEHVYKSLCEGLDLRSFRVVPIYYGKCFRIEGKGNDTFIYIRLEYRNSMMYVNFSNISIDERFQRTGVLTKLVDSVSKQQLIDGVIIGGVCTENMLAWCNKMGFREYSVPMDYIKILKQSN